MQGSVAERKRESPSLRDRGKPQDRGGKQQEKEYQGGKGCVREKARQKRKVCKREPGQGGGRDRKHISEKGKVQEVEEKHKTVRRKKHAREGRSV